MINYIPLKYYLLLEIDKYIKISKLFPGNIYFYFYNAAFVESVFGWNGSIATIMFTEKSITFICAFIL